jgi:hypothetical protein
VLVQSNLLEVIKPETTIGGTTPTYLRKTASISQRRIAGLAVGATIPARAAAVEEGGTESALWLV